MRPAAGTAVYAGLGDAGAATLASGIASPGELNIHLGTSGWVAAISSEMQITPAVFNLVAADADHVINVVPFLNAGNVHAWAAETFADNDHERLQALAAESGPRCGRRALPALSGGRTLSRSGQPRPWQLFGHHAGNPPRRSGSGSTGGRGLFHQRGTG